MPADAATLAPVVAGTRGQIIQSANDEYLQELAEAAKLAVGTRRDDAALAALHAKLLGAAPAGQ
jgi:hypothetical protein